MATGAKKVLARLMKRCKVLRAVHSELLYEYACDIDIALYLQMTQRLREKYDAELEVVLTKIKYGITDSKS